MTESTETPIVVITDGGTTGITQQTVSVGTIPTPTGEYRTYNRSRRATLGSKHAVTKIPIPIPPIPLPFFGSRVLMYKQDPSVQEIGIRKAFLPAAVGAGPRDGRITTQNMPTVTPNVLGDLIETPGTPAFDSVHTFAVVRQTITMYQRALGTPVPFEWNTGSNTDPINVFPHAGVTANAFYSRNDKALKFFFFNTTGPSPRTVFTCRSLDIVAHETGHAVLDGLKPHWLEAGVAQTGALHEAFGDITAIFLALSQFDQVEAVIAQTKANLHDKTFLSDLAEDFGLALGRTNGLRNADNDLRLSQVSTEVHDLSQCFTGTIYDILADWFVLNRAASGGADPSLVLYNTARDLQSVLLRAIKAAPASNATFTDLGNQMLNVCASDGKPAAFRTAIRNQFTRREIVVQSVPFDKEMAANETMKAVTHPSTDAKYGQNRIGCCGTMLLGEYNGLQKHIDSEVTALKAAAAAGGKAA
jgi:hypothetical protein